MGSVSHRGSECDDVGPQKKDDPVVNKADFQRKQLYLGVKCGICCIRHRGSGRDDVGHQKKGDPVVNKADFRRKPLLLGVKCDICCIRHRGLLSDGSWGLFHIVALVATMWDIRKRAIRW